MYKKRWIVQKRRLWAVSELEKLNGGRAESRRSAKFISEVGQVGKHVEVEGKFAKQ